MARARLQDTGASIPVVFFPDAYDRYASQLRTTDPLLLIGTLQLDDERSELHAEEAIPLAEAWTRCTKELCVRLEQDAVTHERLLELRKLLDLEPGEVPVRVELRLSSGAEAVLGLRRHRIAVSEELVLRVDHLFGRQVSECRV
jgi:DNA polymerase III alpha subunit